MLLSHGEGWEYSSCVLVSVAVSQLFVSVELRWVVYTCFFAVSLLIVDFLDPVCLAMLLSI